MNRRPGVVVAAAVLGYVQAGLLVLSGIQILSVGTAIGGIVGGTGWFVFAGLIYLGIATVLVVGGVQLQRGTGRGTFVAGVVIELVFFLILLIASSGDFLLVVLLLYVACPAVALILACSSAATGWLSGVGYGTSSETPVYVAPSTPRPPAMGAGVLRDGERQRAFAIYGQRLMTGQPPWVAETQSLTAVRDAIAASRGSIDAARLLEGLESVARTSPWHAIGVWQFVQEYGLAPWRKSPLLGSFLAGLRKVMDDPATPAVTYRLSVDESDAVRRTEPHDSPLWRLVRPNPDDLEPQTPPAVGAEPTVADLADTEQRLIATIGANQLIATRSAGGDCVATLVRIGNQPGATPTETYARAATYVGLLREVGDKLGRSAADVEASPDLAPYLTFRLPAWWPGKGSAQAPA